MWAVAGGPLGGGGTCTGSCRVNRSLVRGSELGAGPARQDPSSGFGSPGPRSVLGSDPAVLPAREPRIPTLLRVRTLSPAAKTVLTPGSACCERVTEAGARGAEEGAEGDRAIPTAGWQGQLRVGAAGLPSSEDVLRRGWMPVCGRASLSAYRAPCPQELLPLFRGLQIAPPSLLVRTRR